MHAPPEITIERLAKLPHGRADAALATARDHVFGRLRLAAADAPRGLATSGLGGRSDTFGIADAVTVLADGAAAADAAATVVANAVDLPGHAAVRRGPSVRAQSDLGDRAVTLGVGALAGDEVAEALDRGARHPVAARARAAGRRLAFTRRHPVRAWRRVTPF